MNIKEEVKAYTKENDCSVDTFKLIVAGSRKYHNYDFLKIKLDNLLKSINKPVEVVSGEADGADFMGERYAMEKGLYLKRFPAPWDDVDGKPDYQVKVNSYGKPYWVAAGAFRNSQMRDYAEALVCFRKDNSRGSTNMIKQAKQKGLQVRVFDV